MSYATVQTGAATLIKLMDGYTEKNVSEGDYRIFNSGITKGVVLRRGSVNARNLAINANNSRPIISDYIVNIEVYQQFESSPAASRSALTTATDAIMAQLQSYPTLNMSSVILSGPGDVAEPEEGNFAGSGGFQWWQAIITYPVQEVVSVAVTA